MLFWPEIEKQPCCQPEKAESPGRYEGGLPPPGQRNPRHHQRSHECSDIRPRVEYARGQGPLFLGKPFGNSFYRCRKVSRFSKPQHKPSDAKAHHGVHQCVRHRRQTPENDGKGKAFPRAKPIHQTPNKEETDCISCLKDKYYPAVLDFGPADLRLKRRLEDANHLTVDVIDSSRKEQQPTDDPSITPDSPTHVLDNCGRRANHTRARDLWRGLVLFFF